MSDQIIGSPYRIEIDLHKQTPGEPDEGTVIVGWYDTDGTEITDPGRIATLERRAEEIAHANR